MHTFRPQLRQWCRRVMRPKTTAQIVQLRALSVQAEACDVCRRMLTELDLSAAWACECNCLSPAGSTVLARRNEPPPTGDAATGTSSVGRTALLLTVSARTPLTWLARAERGELARRGRPAPLASSASCVEPQCSCDEVAEPLQLVLRTSGYLTGMLPTVLDALLLLAVLPILALVGV